MEVLPLVTCVCLFYLAWLAADRLLHGRPRDRAPEAPPRFFRPDRDLPPPPAHEDAYHPCDARALWQTYFLLRRLLPAELVPPVLERAEYWLRISSRRAEQMAVVEGRPRRYVTTPPVRAPVLRPVRRVVFTVTSRDQGWSSFHRHWHTYENSWTWFDAQVVALGPQGAVQPDPARARRVVTNIHAGQQFHCHTVVWSADDDDAEVRQLVRSIRNGEAVSVVARAMFRLWTNHVGSVQVDLYLAALR